MTRWRVSIEGIVLATCAASVAFAQELPLIRRSAAATPRVSELAVVRQQRVEVGDQAGLADLARSAALTLDLFPDLSLRAIRLSTEGTALRRTWSGVLEGYPDSSVIFASAGDELMGHIHAPFGFFRLDRQADGGYLVQQVDQSIFPEGADAVMPAESGPLAGAAADVPVIAADDDGSVVDVLVAITADAVVGYGGDARARAAIDLIVAEANMALRNSGLSSRLRLVYVAIVPYVETGNYQLDLSRAAAPADGFLDELPSLRQTYAADTVALIVERMEGACGVGYVGLPSANGSLAYSVTHRPCTGNGRTFAHELGHNMGAMHDWYVSAQGGAFSYSKGHVSLAGRFRDLMSYANLCVDTGTVCSQWLGYSNPNLTQNGQSSGVHAGTSVQCQAGNVNNAACDADVTRTFANMMPVVARYRNSATSVNARFEILPAGTVTSQNRRYRLVYQTDGNLVLYDDVLATAPWASNTGGTSPGRVLMQNDGNLVIYDQAGRGIWSTGTAGNPGAFAVLQNDGNLVIYTASGRPLWGRLN